jgi:hypothetical protein
MSDPFERSPIAQAPLTVVLVESSASHSEKALSKWIAYLDTLDRDYEILLVNGESSTSALAAGGVAPNPRVRLLENPCPRGVGTALRSGLREARFPLLCYAECSNSYQPADLGRMLEVIDRVDLVSGYRVGPSSRRPGFWKRYVFRGLLRLLFGLRLPDMDCPFKLFRRSILARIPIQSAGTFAHIEVLAKANFLGGIMCDIPVQYQPGRNSLTEPSSRKAWRTDAARVFFHPDFGPAVLPEQPPAVIVADL